MGLGYGSRFDLSKLSSQEVGVLSKSKSNSSWIGILRIVLGVVEIGMFLIPGVGETLGVVGSTALSLGFGAANEVLDVEGGNANAVGAFLNFGVPVAAGAFSGLRNVASVSRLSENAFHIGETSGDLIGDFNTIGNLARTENAFSAFNKGVASVAKSAKKTGLFLTEDGPASIKELSGVFDRVSKARVSSVATETNDFVGEETRDKLRFIGFKDSEIDRLVAKASTNTKSSTENLMALKYELRNIASTTNSVEVKAFAQHFEQGLSKLGQLNINAPQSAIIYRAFNDAVPEFGSKLLREQQSPWYKRLWRYVGSADFNDKWVQRLQLIDPNDMGRAGVEYLYKKFKRTFGRYLNQTEKSLKSYGKLEQAFEKSGGILLNSSWVMGYKVIVEELGRTLIMISFKPGPSYNKKPVLVWASKNQLKHLVTDSPGSTYQKYWAVSKGGSSVGLSGIFGGGPLKAFSKMVVPSIFGFIKTNQLRNIFSIVSNWVENGSTIIKGNYIYGKTTKTGMHVKGSSWTEHFFGSLTRTSISRTFRLGGKVFLGGLASKYLGASIGRFIGAESQRVGTQIFAVGIKNVIAGKSFSKGLSKSAATGALTSLRSNMLRRYRRTRGSTVLKNTISGQRKISIGRRIPNALVPGRPFTGFKL